uniref:EF-hand domain-containing protein n=2 Tax=Arion vulgaris TaxID=1028688 RepID=A0A0B7A6B5_9EUPU
MEFFRSIKEFFNELQVKILRVMGNLSNKEELSDFQKKKLLHEYHTFFDLNKDGVLEWKDFQLAREKICEKSGWKDGSEKFLNAKRVFTDMWRYLQDDGDANLDGKVTPEEWIRMWQRLNSEYLTRKKEKHFEEKVDKIPDWLERYIEYKFNLFDRTGDGIIDIDEFEYVLGDFGVSPKSARTAFLLFSSNHELRVELSYFRQLCIEFCRSDDQGTLGNFITGKLDFT